MNVSSLRRRGSRIRAGWAIWCAMACAACATGGGSSPGASAGPTSFAAPEPEEAAAEPPPAQTYDTAPHAGGILGGPDAARVAAALAEALRARGDRAEPDGALALAGRRLARDAQEGRRGEMASTDATARRAGFPGVVLWALAYAPDGDDREAWRDGLTQIARNLPVTRYGVSLSPGGRVMAIVLGSVEVALAPFPRRLPPGSAVKLEGEVASRFAFARVYLTGIDGRVQETRMPGRRISVSLTLSRAGVYKVEVLGDGATGPVVLANVPVYAGVPEPTESRSIPAAGGGRFASSAGTGAPSDVAEWPAQLLELLNRARTKERLSPLLPDAELAALALGHSRDMVDHGFFGHQSPTTGGPEDRVRRAGAAVSIVGENVAQADTPGTTHELLMGSPAHRANMLAAKFTHVGIGVATTGQPGIFVTTLVFGRRPPVPAAQQTAEDVKGALTALRAAHGAAPLGIDPGLQAAAVAGVRAYADTPGDAMATRQAFTASERALKADLAQRGGNGVRGACAKLIEILELEDLSHYPDLAGPDLRKMGVAVTVRNDTKPPRLVVLLMLEGSACR